MKAFSFALVAFVITIACNKPDMNHPISVVLPSDSIDLEKKGIIHLTSMDYSDSTFFILNGRSKELFQTDNHFETLYRFSELGRGPGEFLEPYSIATSPTRLYLIDFDQQKIIQFSHDLRPLTELVAQSPIFSILPIDDERLWLGSFSMESETVLLMDFTNRTQKPTGEFVKTRFPMEGLVFHSKNSSGDILRYRQYNHRLDLFPKDGSQLTFSNTTLPERPEVVQGPPGYPVFDKRIHHSAFLTADRACVLSGDHTPGNQPVQCFDFDGNLVARYSLKQDPSMISVYADSMLYTYSPKTNHIYVYTLGF